MIDAIGLLILVLLGGFFGTIAVVGMGLFLFAFLGVPLAALVRFIRG